VGAGRGGFFFFMKITCLEVSAGGWFRAPFFCKKPGCLPGCACGKRGRGGGGGGKLNMGAGWDSCPGKVFKKKPKGATIRGAWPGTTEKNKKGRGARLPLLALRQGGQD